jgi:S-formylglutathione hydrolase FrmB
VKRRDVLRLGALVVLSAGMVRIGDRLGARASATALTVTPAALPDANAAPSPSRIERGTFASGVLRREMSYLAYVPSGYDDATKRYPTLYMLHGSGGDVAEWMNIGLFGAADRLIEAGAIAPLVIVLPEGDQEYWVDHVVDAKTGANGEKWGTYTAREVTATIDARYRTVADPSGRAIGGLSMGGHGAMQLAMNFPEVWTAVGAHSPSLRPEGDAPTYLGTGAAFAARDPLSLIAAKPDVARRYAWWIDAGEADPWVAQAHAISDELTSLDIANEWRSSPGEHSWDYWRLHLEEYLEFYGGALGAAL